MRRLTAQQEIEQRRTVNVSVVLAGELDFLAEYPHPYLAVCVDDAGRVGSVPQALIGAEILRPHGWELISVAYDGTSRVHAVLRKLPPRVA